MLIKQENKKKNRSIVQNIQDGSYSFPDLYSVTPTPHMPPPTLLIPFNTKLIMMDLRRSCQAYDDYIVRCSNQRLSYIMSNGFDHPPKNHMVSRFETLCRDDPR